MQHTSNRIKSVGLLFFTLFFSLPLFADQLIIEPDMGRKPLLDEIRQTQHNLDLVMYGFTDEAFLNAILKQQQSGRTVKIILEQTPYKADNENLKIQRAFNDHQLSWKGNIPGIKLIHQKTLLVDDKHAVVMTFNFTNSTFKNQRNFALIIDDPQKVKTIEDMFAADWNHHPIYNHNPDLIYSPDNSRAALLQVIQHAKQTLQIYAQSVTDYKIVGALAKAAKNGVKVEILTSASLRGKQVDYLTRAGVTIRQSSHYYIHAKLFIVDHELAVIGSINLTKPSIDQNRELSVITRDPQVIKQLSDTFAKDWNATNGLTHTSHHSNIPSERTILRVLRLMQRALSSH